MLVTREITFSEIENIYINYLCQDFPSNEVKPLTSMERMYKQGKYQGFVLEEEGNLRAYWFLLRDEKNDAYLLDYLAVSKEMRGKGYGSKALGFIADSLKGQGLVVIEAENPKKAKDGEEKLLQERRLEFYKRNGVFFTSLASVVYDAAYVIMYLSKKNTPLNESEIEKIYVDFYEMSILGKEKCEKHFIME